MDLPELPECPVCLQPFDAESTIPRVLACGHSACDSCLIHLPKPPFPRTLRCPACTQLVTYPHPQGPSALPKNIDLLRISSSLNPSHLNSKPKKPITSFQDFIPSSWTNQFYSNWKDRVVPQDAILIDTSLTLDGSCLYGRVVNLKAPSGIPTRCSLKCDQKVSLFKVGSFVHNDDSRLKYSYVSKVMWVLFHMGDGALAELGLIFLSCLKEYRICTGYGLWYNEEDESLYLVCERNDTSLLNVIGSEVEDDMSSFAVIGMELCEAVSGLHEAELVTGCTSLPCFGITNFGHVFVHLNEVLVAGQRVQNMITKAVTSFAQNTDGNKLEMDLSNDIIELNAFPSPELLVEFVRNEGVDLESAKSTCAVGYSSDVWSLACILLSFLVGKSFIEETHNFLCGFILTSISGNGYDCEGLYMAWLDKVSSLLDVRLGLDYVVMKDLLHKCLCFNPESRPIVVDLWKCTRELVFKPKFDVIGSSYERIKNGSRCHCLLLGELYRSLNKTNKVDDKCDMVSNVKDENLVVKSDLIEGLCKNSLKCVHLKGHLDCISGLAVGGGFLFSSSFDKTVNVWSLQDFNHVHTFKGHEHRVTAIAFVKSEPLLCISGDNGGGIFIWGIKVPFEEKAIKVLNEEKDWRYSGIHALAVSGSGYFYTGSGDKSIKAWSMHWKLGWNHSLMVSK